MKRLGIALLILAAGAGSALADGSPFAGSWKLNTAKSKFTGDTFAYTATPTGFHFSDGGPLAYDFAINGKDYPVVADRTMAWTKAGADSWDTVTKAKGKVLSRGHRTLSADGKTLTESFVEYRADGTTANETDVYARVSGRPGLAGEWKDVKVKTTSDTMTIATPSAGRYEITYPADKQTIAGATDGTPAKLGGPNIPPGLKIAYVASGPTTWRWTVGIDGKVFDKGVMTLSADGKTMTRKSWVPGKESEAEIDVFDRQ